ncbi:unnamed protein product [Peniophora sp. CBMAI 1063]|nr:unnamed protein product [Peniophora sp. CBMAI 1063]
MNTPAPLFTALQALYSELKERHSLQDELNSLVGDLTSSLNSRDEDDDGVRGPTLLEDLVTMHRNLKEQESIRVYVGVVQRALVLSEAVVKQARESAPIGVGQYIAPRQYAESVSGLCAQIGEATGQPETTLRLVTFVQEIRDKTWGDIKSALTSELLTAAEKIGWPKPVDCSAVQEADRAVFAKAFRRLLELQTIGQRVHDAAGGAPDSAPGLYALQALVQPVALRFKYHFEGTRATNKLDKPEWYFTHILNVAHEHREFMEGVVQLFLQSTPYKEVDAWREFAFNLLPLLHRRIKRTMPLLLPHPPLLAHTICQALAFDAALREEGFGLSGTYTALSASTPVVEEWNGVSATILDRKEWLDHWIESERDFALEQYNDIMLAPDAWTFADVSETDAPAHAGELKPTISARRLTALLAGATDRMVPLPAASQRAWFLTAVQLPLLDSYRVRVSASLDAFETLSHSLVRAVPAALSAAVTSECRGAAHLISGVEGAGRLIKALMSAMWVRQAMGRWGEEIIMIFLELCADMHVQAALRVRAEGNPLLPNPAPASSAVDAAPDGTLFDVLVTAYAELVREAEDMLVQLVTAEVEGLLKHYFAELHGDDQPMSSADTLISPALLPGLAVFGQHIHALAQALCTHIPQRALLYRRPGRVPVEQGKRLQGEMALWAETARGALPAGVRAEAPWARLVQAGRVVGAEGDVWEGVLRVASGFYGLDNMEEYVGGTELSEEEVGMIVGVRADYDA